MTRYLVLAHQTANSPELVAALKELAGRETGSTFTLVVPAAPLSYWGTWEENRAHAFAEEQAESAVRALELAGVPGVRTIIGNRYPMDALADELRDGPGYDELVICTLPAGVSRWLKLDLPHQAARRFGVPVTHVVAAERVAARV